MKKQGGDEKQPKVEFKLEDVIRSERAQKRIQPLLEIIRGQTCDTGPVLDFVDEFCLSGGRGEDNAELFLLLIYAIKEGLEGDSDGLGVFVEIAAKAAYARTTHGEETIKTIFQGFEQIE